MVSISYAESGTYQARLQRRESSNDHDIWALLDSVNDPEIPVLSLWDLGVLTNIENKPDELVITLSPTYIGCPAMDAMRQDLQTVLALEGHQNIRFETSLSPAWGSDWISPEGLDKLRAYGIAPPQHDYACASCADSPSVNSINCPHCGSCHTQQISEFGSTACKALHRCQSCLEPFDYFKPI